MHCVDLVKSFPTRIYLQNLASIQKRTSPVKFAHLAEKSGKGSISNLSTKVVAPEPREEQRHGAGVGEEGLVVVHAVPSRASRVICLTCKWHVFLITCIISKKHWSKRTLYVRHG